MAAWHSILAETPEALLIPERPSGLRATTPSGPQGGGSLFGARDRQIGEPVYWDKAARVEVIGGCHGAALFGYSPESSAFQSLSKRQAEKSEENGPEQALNCIDEFRTSYGNQIVRS